MFIKAQAVIIAGFFISLLISGCHKSDNTQAEVKDNLQTAPKEEMIPREQLPDNDENLPPKPDQDANSPLPNQDDEQTNSNPENDNSESDVAEQQDNPQNDLSDNSDAAQLNESDKIAAATKQVHDKLKSLSSAFASCHSKAQKTCNDKGVKPYGTKDLSYNLEYDEFGVIYFVEDTFDREHKKWDRCQTDYDTCFRKALPKSFKFDLSDIVKNYPDNIQRFGRIKLVFNTNTSKVSIIDAYSKPIGTVHQNNLDKPDGPYGTVLNVHYEKWLKRRAI